MNTIKNKEFYGCHTFNILFWRKIKKEYNLLNKLENS